MENEKTWDEDFNWFAEEHYESHNVVAGSREAILTAFHEFILTKWPNRKFGTTLSNIRQEKNEWSAIVRRFKTEELCKKHCDFPPTYIRIGEVSP